MNRSTALTIATMPAVAGLAWRNHRRIERAASIHQPEPPYLPGERRVVETNWGSAAYRLVRGDETLTPLALIHGWGKSGDTAWWPILQACRASMVVVDLPGHGDSSLCEPFTFELAADALLSVLNDARIDRPILAAHSMGGPVALSAIREAGADAFAGLVAMATSAYWVTPRVRAMMALAPYVMSPGSPVVTRTKLHDVSRHPGRAPQICWSYGNRPLLPMLREGATALRRFDATRWGSIRVPRAHWVVSNQDRVLPAYHQHASARLFGATVHQLDAGHSIVMDAPDEIARILDEVAAEMVGAGRAQC